MATEQQAILSSRFFTNKGGNTLIKEFEGILSQNPQICYLDAVVGFLRASGYFSLRPFLNNIQKVRVLVGINVDKYIVQATRRGELFLGEETQIKEECLGLYQKDIERAEYRADVEEGVRQMRQDLADGKLELRAHPSKKIHAKVYVLYPEGLNQYKPGLAITGSSNLSGNGLGIAEESQYEFNVKLTQYEDVRFALNEFETLWEEAKNCEIKAEDLQTSIDRTYLKGDASPYDVYIKMLMEYFEDRVLETDKQNPFDVPDGYAKYDYQIDAAVEGYRKLIKYDGFFLADVVGLGKTVIATMIAKKFLIENGYDCTKILVVYPPAVEQNWKTTFKDFGIDKYAKFITNGSLSKILDEENYDYWNAEEYDLILVDEAHKFRSHTTNAFERLQEICKMPRLETGNIKGHKKKVMLISATPMNNTPADLYNEILLFQDARRCTIDGVGNLTTFFAPLVEEFKRLQRRKDANPDMSAYRALANKVRSRIIKPLTVRRTRTDIESVERYRKDIQKFPKVERPIESRYELNDRLARLFEQAVQILEKDLTYARHQAIAFLRPEANAGLYDNAEVISRALAGIQKNGLVKRLESSFYAFQKSIERFRQANQNMIDMFGNDKVYIAPDLDINALIAGGMEEDEIEEKLNAKAEENPKNHMFHASDFDAKYIEMLRKDQEFLDKMHEAWSEITDEDDSKFAKFDDLLRHEFFKQDRNPGQKLVVFSESEETIEYLKRRIGRKDVIAISTKNRAQEFKTIRDNFDANWSVRANDFNIILTTDVLAEGVNLHRSNVIVNYDAPWNSTRLMQRIGRVNRIGSVSDHIYNYVFYPSREGNRELNLNKVVIGKLQTFHTTFGEDNQIYSQEEIVERNPIKLYDESVKAEKNDFDREIPFYEELRDLYCKDRKEYERIRKTSVRSRTGRASRAVGGVTLSGDTLVFLKTNFRKVFFLVSEEARDISVPEALSYFKAEKEEKGVERIAKHHVHVQKALELFQSIREEETVFENAPGQKENLGQQVTAAVALLTAFLREIDDPDFRLEVVQLKKLVERGTITKIAKRLQRIQKDLRRTGGKARMTHDEALAEIAEMARKYAPYCTADDAKQNEPEIEAEIILSESFADA